MTPEDPGAKGALPAGRRKARAVRELPGRGSGSEERWEIITRAARQCFSEHGYDAASLADIAALAGLSKGALYYYIDSKEALLFALISRRVERRVTLLHEPLSQAVASADTRLRGFIARWFADSVEDGEWAVVSERGFVRLAPEHRDRILGLRAQVHQFLEQLVQQGIDEGVFGTQLPPGLAAELVLGLLKSVGEVSGGAEALAPEASDLYASFVIGGLAGAAAPRPAPATTG